MISGKNQYTGTILTIIKEKKEKWREGQKILIMFQIGALVLILVRGQTKNKFIIRSIYIKK